MIPPASALHVVQGTSAGGCLREAMRSGRPQGTLAVVPDDLSHGPVGDRAGFWRSSYRGYLPDEELPEDLPEVWAAVDQAVAQTPRDVVVWGGSNPSDAVLLAAVCERLADSDVSLWQVDVSRWSEGRGPHYVAEYEPTVLATAWPEAVRPLTPADRGSWRAIHGEIAASGDTVRRIDDGVLHCLPTDHYDSALLAVCPDDWTPAARVVGAAMGGCDDDNKMSDVFFTMRLQHLIDSGAVEVDGPRDSLRSYRLRRTDRRSAPGGSGL